MTKKGISVEQAQEIRNRKGIEETKLQKMRIRKNYSQKQLAVASGVTMRSVQCYEQRTRDIDGARLETLCDLCIALDCKLEDILESELAIDKLRMTK